MQASTDGLRLRTRVCTCMNMYKLAHDMTRLLHVRLHTVGRGCGIHKYTQTYSRDTNTSEHTRVAHQRAMVWQEFRADQGELLCEMCVCVCATWHCKLLGSMHVGSSGDGRTVLPLGLKTNSTAEVGLEQILQATLPTPPHCCMIATLPRLVLPCAGR